MARERRQARICLPEFPADYTSIIAPDPANVLRLASAEGAPAGYSTEGWIEHSLETPETGRKDEVGFAIRNLNVAARLLGEARPDFPARLHARLPPGERPRTLMSLRTGDACLTVPIQLEYDELGRDPRQLRRPRRGHLPAIVPLTSALTVAFHYDIRAGGFSAAGTGRLRRLPPFTEAPVALTFALFCPCDRKSYCLDVCLSIKVATEANGNPVPQPADIRDLVSLVNDIWDCSPPAQCCIRFTAKEILAPLEPRVPPSIELKDGDYSDDYKRVIRINRSAECYNVVLVKNVTGAALTGQTGYGEQAGTFVKTGGRPAADNAQTLAHELGHALGLARGNGTDADGVTDHSTKADNLMNPTEGAAKTKLNKKQCDRARSSGLAKRTDAECTPAPGES